MLLLILVFQRQRDRSGSDRGTPGWHSIKRSGISHKAHQRRRYPDYLLIWSRASLNRLDLRFRPPRSNSHGSGAPVFGKPFWPAGRDAIGTMSLISTTGQWRVLRGDPFWTPPPLIFRQTDECGRNHQERSVRSSLHQISATTFRCTSSSRSKRVDGAGDLGVNGAWLR